MLLLLDADIMSLVRSHMTCDSMSIVCCVSKGLYTHSIDGKSLALKKEIHKEIPILARAYWECYRYNTTGKGFGVQGFSTSLFNLFHADHRLGDLATDDSFLISEAFCHVFPYSNLMCDNAYCGVGKASCKRDKHVNKCLFSMF